MIARFLFVALCAGGLAACASTTQSPQSEAEREAQALAALLVETAERAPDRIYAAEAERSALQAALTGARPPIAPSSQTAPVGGDQERPSPALRPAPDLNGARSVLSAVHLASYREAGNAAAGWSQLRAARPDDLAGLRARLFAVDLGARGRFLRLKAGPLDTRAAAEGLCARMNESGDWCAVTDFTGTPLHRAE